MARDFLVIYEEADDGVPVHDNLVLDVEGMKAGPNGEIDLEQELDLDLSNKASRVGTLGFVITCLGALLGLALVVAFAIVYPHPYYDSRRALNISLSRTFMTLSFAATLLLLAGNILTFYGRRIKASANLSAVRIIEKAQVPHARSQ